MTPEGRQEELWEELRVDSLWVHICRYLFDHGKVREMGFTAWAVYCAIKVHANLDTGRASPSQEHLGELLGVTAETISQATKVLVRMKLLEERKVGRHKEYRLIERAPITTQDGQVLATGEFRYAPMGFAKRLEELKRLATAGLPPGSHITVNFNVNFVSQGDHSTVTINQVSSPEFTPDKLRELAQRLRTLEG